MKRNPWPYAIALYFIVFIALMTKWIVFAVRNDDQLVRKDYYEQDLKFQNELDSFQRAAASKVHLAYDPNTRLLKIILPMEASGTIHFYRPSNLNLDRQLPLNVKSGAQTVNVSDLDAGLWKVRLTWISNGAEYRHDERLIL